MARGVALRCSGAGTGRRPALTLGGTGSTPPGSPVSAGPEAGSGWTRPFGFLALVLAAVNIFGGFLVTQRMLAMYRKKAK